MHRAFDPSPSRHRIALDGRWEFTAGDPDRYCGTDEGGAEDSVTDDGAGFDPTTAFDGATDRMTVPGCWQTRARYHDHHGVGWYRREFSLPDATNLRLRFEAVAHEATVFVDGDRVTSHTGGYTPFEVLLPDVEAGEHEVIVRVDSRLDETTIPKPDTDWFPYGGITREVFAEELPDVFVEDLRLEYDLDGDTAVVDASVTLRNLGEAVEPDVGLAVGGRDTTGSVEVPPGTATVRRTLALADIDRWSPSDPQLYDAAAWVDCAEGASARRDERRERVGFRDVSVDGRGIRVNGDPVEICGVNRHEDHPEHGHAQPARLMELDLDVLADLGANTVRTSHYPNHPRFLDYCDEAGLLVIEEIPYWQFGPEQVDRDGILAAGERMLAEMVDRDYHHPSVIAWSLHNECATESDALVEATEALAETARERDETRPLTYATNNDYVGTAERCQNFVDFLCLNAYWGWYDESRTWTEYLDEMADTYDCPLVVSEFGAGAVAGERTHERQKWSETYQAALLVDAIGAIRDHEAFAGFTIWQYCDTRTQPSGFAGRPKTKNNKGIVTEYRRPKDAFDAVRDLLDGE